MEYDSSTIVISFLVTVFMYEILPLISKYILKERFSKKECKKLAFFNSVLVYVIFTLIHIFIIKDNRVASVPPAVLWGLVAYSILNSNNKNATNKENIIKNTNENYDYINQLERISSLYKNGYLSEEEFNNEKQKILNHK